MAEQQIEIRVARRVFVGAGAPQPLHAEPHLALIAVFESPCTRSTLAPHAKSLSIHMHTATDIAAAPCRLRLALPLKPCLPRPTPGA